MSSPITRRYAATKPELADDIASEFSRVIADALRARGVAHVALTGGSMGTAFVGALGRSNAEPLDFSRVHFWWGDERFCALTSEDRNDVQAFAAGLGDHASAAHFHRVGSPDTMTLDEATDDYAQQLAAFSSDGTSVHFDIVMLGMGPDTHVASLFPGRSQSTLTDVMTAAVSDSPKPPAERITLTFPALNHTRQMWLMIAGPDKADAVSAAIDATDKTAHPASGVRGEEDTIWWMDAAAASKISR